MNLTKGIQTTVIHVSDWEKARRIGKLLERWLFRGQRNAEWPLKSSLERAYESRGFSFTQTRTIEELILMDFKSAAHLFSESVPEAEDTIAWLSLLRHHGGPTRLLDFTESFYVAAYFALENATGDCAIWAFNRIDFMTRAIGIINALCKQLNIDINLSEKRKLNEILMNTIRGNLQNNMVITMNPSQRNERQFLQQGLAVIPLNIQDGFMSALLSSFKPPGRMPKEENMRKIEFEELPDIIQESKLMKIVMDKDCLLDARLDLEKMNINGATLFRGLDGLGRHVHRILNTVEHHLRELNDQSSG